MLNEQYLTNVVVLS